MSSGTNTPTATTARPTEAHAPGAPPRRAWKAVHYWALLGVVLGLYATWIFVAWITDGPTQVTEFRDSSDVSWWAARVIEAVSIAIAVAMLVYLVRDYMKKRELTLIARICIACVPSGIFDSFINFYQPVWLYSSQFVNLNAPCGHAPFVVNPDCGAMAWPVIFVGLFYIFALPACAMLVCLLLQKVRARWPDISTVKVVLLVFLFSCILDVPLNGGLTQLHTWILAGSPDWFSIGGAAPTKYSFVVMIFGDAPIFTATTLLLFYRDDRGQTFIERGLDQVRPRARTAVGLLSHVGYMSAIVIISALAVAWWGAYSSPYAKFPAHLINKMCDGAGSPHTAYGPCPGGDGYKMPVRHN